MATQRVPLEAPPQLMGQLLLVGGAGGSGQAGKTARKQAAQNTRRSTTARLPRLGAHVDCWHCLMAQASGVQVAERVPPSRESTHL